MQELERAGQQYERGFTETGKQPPGSLGGLGNLARGSGAPWQTAPQRETPSSASSSTKPCPLSENPRTVPTSSRDFSQEPGRYTSMPRTWRPSAPRSACPPAPLQHSRSAAPSSPHDRRSAPASRPIEQLPVVQRMGRAAFAPLLARRTDASPARRICGARIAV